MITQQSLAHNLKLITTGLSATDDTVVVSWLPQYHDMGLIGSYLGALYVSMSMCVCKCVCMCVYVYLIHLFT